MYLTQPVGVSVPNPQKCPSPPTPEKKKAFLKLVYYIFKVFYMRRSIFFISCAIVQPLHSYLIILQYRLSIRMYIYDVFINIVRQYGLLSLACNIWLFLSNYQSDCIFLLLQYWVGLKMETANPHQPPPLVQNRRGISMTISRF